MVLSFSSSVFHFLIFSLAVPSSFVKLFHLSLSLLNLGSQNFVFIGLFVRFLLWSVHLQLVIIYYRKGCEIKSTKHTKYRCKKGKTQKQHRGVRDWEWCQNENENECRLRKWWTMTGRNNDFRHTPLMMTTTTTKNVRWLSLKSDGQNTRKKIADK